MSDEIDRTEAEAHTEASIEASTAMRAEATHADAANAEAMPATAEVPPVQPTTMPATAEAAPAQPTFEQTGAQFASATTPPPGGPTFVPVAAPMPQRRRRTWIPVTAALLVGAVVGGAAGAGVTLAISSTSPFGQTSTPPQGPQTITVGDYDDATLITAVAERAMSSVVTIEVRGRSGGSSGSGVALDDQGHIVTNNHVVALDGSDPHPRVRVTTSSGRIYDATIVGTDPIMDLAVIQIEEDGWGDLTPVEFADSDALNVGDTTVAIGAPLGLSGTVTSGIISSLGRSIQVRSTTIPDEPEDEPEVEDEAPEDDRDGGWVDPFDFFSFDLPDGFPTPDTSRVTPSPSSLISLSVIQTDTAINRGNSGGALLDSDGRLIGINVAIATGTSTPDEGGSIGVGFAIPSNVVKRVTDELIEHGVATHGLLGASVANVLDDPNQVDPDVMGASIVEIVPGGAADKAGLKVGDIVIAFGGQPVTNRVDLTALVRTYAAGSEVELTFVRNGRTGTVTVELGDLADAS